MKYSFVDTMYTKMNRYLDAAEELWLLIEPAHPTLDLRPMRQSWNHILFVSGSNGEANPFTRFGSASEAEFRTHLYEALTEVLPAPYHPIITSICVSGGSGYAALRLVRQRYQEYVADCDAHAASDSASD
jgi:hypothetical protein